MRATIIISATYNRYKQLVEHLPDVILMTSRHVWSPPGCASPPLSVPAALVRASSSAPLKSLLFDMDGVLAEVSQSYRQAVIEVCLMAF